MTAIPFIGAQAYFPDLAGAALANGSVYFWQAGTNNVPMTTWRNFGQTVINPNPVPLTSAGVPLYEIWGDGGYHIMWYDADNNLIGEIDDFFLTQNTGIPFCVTTGSPNAYIANPIPPIQGLTDGLTIQIEANFTNTGASTINVSSTGVLPIQLPGGIALVGGEIKIGGLYFLTEIGNVWYLTNPSPLLSNYYVSTGSAGAYIITTSQGIGAYKNGMQFNMLANFGNVTAPTINIDGVGAVHIVVSPGEFADAYHMNAGYVYNFVYANGNFYLLNPDVAITINMAFNPTNLGGFLPLDGSTVAKTSGATYNATVYFRAYDYLWNNLTNGIAPVAGGRGVSSTADWNANKAMTFPNFTNFSPMGVGSIVTQAGGTTGASTHTPTGTISGTVGTTGSHTLDITEIPAHTHLFASQQTPAISFAGGNAPYPHDYPGDAQYTTSSAGGGAGHTHTGGSFTGTFTGISSSTQSPVFGVYYYINY